jgi:hypothetical protein
MLVLVRGLVPSSAGGNSSFEKHSQSTEERADSSLPWQNPNGAEANAVGRSGNARALCKQGKCGMIQEGEGHWPNSSENLQKARNLWVLRTPQNNKEEDARAKELVTCGTRSPLGRGQSMLLCFLSLPVLSGFPAPRGLRVSK